MGFDSGWSCHTFRGASSSDEEAVHLGKIWHLETLEECFFSSKTTRNMLEYVGITVELLQPFSFHVR